MYLSAKQYDQLRNVISNFEIAYRSYIASEFLKKCPTASQFEIDLNSLVSVLSSSSAVLSGFLKAKATHIKSHYGELFNELIFCNDCYEAKKIVKDHDVPDVSEIVAITYLFSNLFRDIISNFKSPAEFITLSDFYHNTRNKIMHVGSKLISEDDMLDVLCFISTSSAFLNDSYFWFKPKQEIEQEINMMFDLATVVQLPKSNLSEIPFNKNRIVCREDKLEILSEYIYGKPGGFNKPTSLCIYGYGGVGKTALVLEFVKNLLKDVVDGFTKNNYVPDFVFFFSAKDIKLSTSETTGNIEKIALIKNFDTFDELKNRIFAELNISDFSGFDRPGIVIIDNFESLSLKDREQTIEFVKFRTPPSIQYVITSRNAEPFEEKIAIKEFDTQLGINFIDEYVKENNLSIELSYPEKLSLVDLAQGNTLVIVLSLHRLNMNLATLSSITSDFSSKVNFRKIQAELSSIPKSAFEIISEFMYKNTFEEIELYHSNTDLISSILKILAVYNEDIEIYTLSTLAKKSFSEIEDVLELLCKYLIVEKHGEYYSINQFANKYILDRFIPNVIEFNALSEEIDTRVKSIKRELHSLEDKMKSSPQLEDVISDWSIISYGDKIAAAKAFDAYNDIAQNIKYSNPMLNMALDKRLMEFAESEVTTIHPYIRFQKARIMDLLRIYGLATEEHLDIARKAYTESIQIIKWNYPQIKATKSYAFVLWFYGTFLLDNGFQNASRYLEDAISSFESLNIKDDNYYQCLMRLCASYIDLYEESRNKTYLRQARSISARLKNECSNYSYEIRQHSFQLADRLKQFGR